MGIQAKVLLDYSEICVLFFASLHEKNELGILDWLSLFFFSTPSAFPPAVSVPSPETSVPGLPLSPPAAAACSTIYFVGRHFVQYQTCCQWPRYSLVASNRVACHSSIGRSAGAGGSSFSCFTRSRSNWCAKSLGLPSCRVSGPQGANLSKPIQ